MTWLATLAPSTSKPKYNMLSAMPLLFSPTRPMFKMFDLESDPDEFTNLIGKPEHVALEQELKAK